MVSRISFLLLFILIYLSVGTSCKKENSCDCFKGTGNKIKESRTPSDFNYIELHDNIDLIITQDTFNKIEVEGGQQLLPNLETSFENDKLIIKNNNKCNWVRTYKKKFTVYLTLKELKQIEYFGAGNITSTNTIIADTLKINFWNASGKVDISINTNNNFFGMHTGPGELYVRGTTNDNYLYYACNGFAHLENLQTTYTFVVSNGTGDCYINNNYSLKADIKYIGNVYYYGNPSIINPTITGKGQLIKLY